MNYTQFFANGGKVDTKTIKSEIGRIFQIEDENKINALWQNAVQEYGSDENVLNALLTEIGDNTSDESIQAAMMKVLNYTPMEESQIFKCGGKLQQLVTKFGKGGGVDCGCGGIKLGRDGMETDGPETMNWVGPKLAPFIAELTSRRVPDAGPAIRRRVGTIRDKNGTVHYFESADVNGRSARTNITAMPGDTTVVQEVLRDGIGMDPKKYTRQDDQYEPIMQRARPFINGVPYKQEGGELTRRQARQLAAQNKGFNGAQFDLAMTNVKDALRANSDLRGRALRQRAREIVSGITDPSTPRQMEALPTVEPITNTPLVGTIYKDGLVGQRPIGSTDQLSFADRFKLARGRGEQTFDWRGKSYGTSLTEKPTSSNETSNIHDPFIKNYTPVPKQIELSPKREQMTIENENGVYSSIVPIERHGLKGTAYSFNSGKYGPDGLPLGFSSYREVIPEQPNVVRTGRNDNNEYYEVSDGVRGIDTNNNLYIKTFSNRNPYGNIIPAGRYFEQGGQIEKDITKTLKCGGKAKKKK